MIASDRFCHKRELWDKFKKQAVTVCDLGPNGTNDEMLLNFRGLYFRQHMPSKRGRKIWILADAETYYCYKAIPYLRKEGDKPAVNIGVKVVKMFVEPIHNTC